MRAIYVMVLSMCLFTTGCKCSVSVDDRKREDLSMHSDAVIAIKNAVTSDPSMWHTRPRVEVSDERGVFQAVVSCSVTSVKDGTTNIVNLSCTAYGKDTKTALENLKEKLTSKKGANSEAR